MIRRFLFCMLITVSVCHLAFALESDDKQTLAVNGFVKTGISPLELERVTEKLRQLLINSKFWNVRTNDEQEQIINRLKVEEQKSVECGDIKCAIAFGQKLGVSKLAYLTVQKPDNTLEATLEFINITTGISEFSTSVTGQSISDLIEKTDFLADKINALALLEGEVMKISDLDIITSFSAKDPIQSGSVLAIFSIDGGVPHQIGKAKITDIQNDQSTAHIFELNQGDQVRRNDRVRLTREQIQSAQNQGYLKISTGPGLVDISIDNGLIKTRISDEASQSFPLSVGSHTVVLSKTGFQTENRKIDINKEQSSLLDVQLTRILAQQTLSSNGLQTGKLKIETDPAGAIVLIDDVEQDLRTSSPMETVIFEDIPFGKHTITIIKDLYYPVKVDAVVQHRGINNVFSEPRKLMPNFAVVKINSEPTSATLYINGEQMSKTPFQKQLRSGTYEIKLIKDRYHDFFQTIQLSDNQTFSQTFSLKKNFGTLDINSEPPGAQILINDEIQSSNTPYKRTDMRSDKYKIILKMDYYKPYTGYFTVKDDQTTQETIRLEPLFGLLNVTSIPSGYPIFLDNKLYGKTPLIDQKLYKGSYNLEVRGDPDTWEIWQKDFEIKIGDSIRMEAGLAHKKGDLTVLSSPTNARIRLDNQWQSKRTPDTLLELITGQHSLYLETDKEALEQVVTIKPGENKVNFTLKPRKALIPMPVWTDFLTPGTWQFANKVEIPDKLNMGFWTYIPLGAAIFFQLQGNDMYQKYKTAVKQSDIDSYFTQANTMQTLASVFFGITGISFCCNILDLLYESRKIQEAKDVVPPESAQAPIVSRKSTIIPPVASVSETPKITILKSMIPTPDITDVRTAQVIETKPPAFVQQPRVYSGFFYFKNGLTLNANTYKIGKLHVLFSPLPDNTVHGTLYIQDTQNKDALGMVVPFTGMRDNTQSQTEEPRYILKSLDDKAIFDGTIGRSLSGKLMNDQKIELNAGDKDFKWVKTNEFIPAAEPIKAFQKDTYYPVFGYDNRWYQLQNENQQGGFVEESKAELIKLE